MRLTSAERILKGIMGLWQGQSALPGGTEFGVARDGLDLSLREGWRQEWWAELMRGEERYFRAPWLATSVYGKTDEAYDAATQQYFQSLRTGVTGAGQSPTDSAGDERSGYWAVCRTTYSGPNWDDGSVSYAAGAIVLYPVTNRYYQCHTAHTSSAVLTPDATGGSERWGVLTAFERYVDKDASGQTTIGDVFDVKTENPRVTKLWDPLEWQDLENRIYVVDEVVRCWIEFRIKPPRVSGEAYDATLGYAVGDQVYFDDDGDITGNFYNCVATAAAGDDPVSDPEKWELVELPEFLEGFLIYASYAKCLTGDDREDKGPAALAMAGGYLEIEADNVYRQQGQAPAQSVRTY